MLDFPAIPIQEYMTHPLQLRDKPHTLGTAACIPLTKSVGLQFRWAAMQFLVATSSFPVALSYVRESSALRTQLAQCALHPLISGVNTPLPRSPALTESLPRSGDSLPRPRPFPSDPHTPAELVRDLAHGAYHVLALVHAFTGTSGEVQAQLYTAAAALMMEVQAQDVHDRAPTLVTLLQTPPDAAAVPPPAPAVKLAVETLRRATRTYVRAVQVLFGAPVLLVALETLVQVEVRTDSRVGMEEVTRASANSQAGMEEVPRRNADDGARDVLPPLTVRDAGGGGAGPPREMPQEIVDWVMQHMKRNNIKTTDPGLTDMPMSMSEYEELSALMHKHNMSEATVPVEVPAGGGRSGTAGGGGTLAFGVARGNDSAAATSVSSRGSLPAEDGSGRGTGTKQGAGDSNGAQSLSPWGAPPPVAQAVVRVAVSQSGLGLGREGTMAGAAPTPAVTLASTTSLKAGISSTMFPGESGDILLSHFSETIREGAQQVRHRLPRCPALLEAAAVQHAKLVMSGADVTGDCRAA